MISSGGLVEDILVFDTLIVLAIGNRRTKATEGAALDDTNARAASL